MVQDQAHIHGALIVLRCLARKYEFKDEEEREPLAAIVNGTFPTLMQIFLVSLPVSTQSSTILLNCTQPHALAVKLDSLGACHMSSECNLLAPGCLFHDHPTQMCIRTVLLPSWPSQLQFQSFLVM